MNEHIENICKIGQGGECCRYLICGAGGFECAKHTELKDVIDQRVSNNIMTAQGNNCEGYPGKHSLTILNKKDDEESSNDNKSV